MRKPAKQPRIHQFSIDDDQVEILVDALRMRREYLAVALDVLDRDTSAGQTRRELDATDALLRLLYRRWPRSA